MKLHLKNFKCHEKKSFDFGNTGTVLLSGASGMGKTTVLQAIYFVLQGVGTKIIQYGKSSCLVTLEIDNWIIKRSKRPNQLILRNNDRNVSYEDEAAQNMINNMFGKTFKTTGYISQNARNSFVLMSPIEKLAFLESFAFQEFDLNMVKKKCKKIIKERKESLVKTVSKLEMASEMFKEIEKPKKICFPFKCSLKNRPRISKNENIRYKNSLIMIKRTIEKINKLTTEMHSTQLLKSKINSTKKQIANNNIKITQKQQEIKEIKFCGNDQLVKYERQLQTVIEEREMNKLGKKCIEDCKQLENMKIKETEENDKNIARIEENIKHIENSHDSKSYKDEIEELAQILDDVTNIDFLKKKLECYKDNEDSEKLTKYQNQISSWEQELQKEQNLLENIIKEGEMHLCPVCQVKLSFNGKKLSLYSFPEFIEENKDLDDMKKNINNHSLKIEKIKAKTHSLKNNIKKRQEINKEIQDILQYYDNNSPPPSKISVKKQLKQLRQQKTLQEQQIKELASLNSQLSKYKENNLSRSLQIFEQNLIRNQHKWDEWSKKNPLKSSFNEETIRNTIEQQKINKTQVHLIKKMIRSIQDDIQTLTDSINEINKQHIMSYKKIRSTDLIKSHIKNKKIKLAEFTTQKNLHKKNIEDIDKFTQYQKNIATYNSWEQKIKKLTSQETEHRKLYGGATRLKETIIEAESIAMRNVISSINSSAQIYLESFFPNDPISVKLSPFKETKKGKKPQIHLDIEYKGMEAGINMLSGGELSRVVLAFTLALGEMFNTPLMMLDECTASLDQELTGVVMESIKDNFNGKLVLVIAHQVIKGSYDKVVDF
jgi:DNA repair exonuclease SbcCD ATPase subunit